ncbi:hypothetical protein [Phyllobacterium leguminum]|nr:hypothetical protein [Phyllobacterium leguminum]
MADIALPTHSAILAIDASVDEGAISPLEGEMAGKPEGGEMTSDFA